MAGIDVERTEGNKRKNNNRWVWVVVVIIALIVAWIALSERSDVGEVETPAEPVVTQVFNSGD